MVPVHLQFDWISFYWETLLKNWFLSFIFIFDFREFKSVQTCMNISEPNYRILFSATGDNSYDYEQSLLFGDVRGVSRKIQWRKKDNVSMLVKAFFASSVAASHLKWLLKRQMTYQALKIFGDCFHKGGQYKFYVNSAVFSSRPSC